MAVDSCIASDLSEETIAFLNPSCKFLGINLPDPTKGITRIGPSEFERYSSAIMNDTFKKYLSPSDDDDERDTLYFNEILPRIEIHAENYKEVIWDEKNEKVFEPNIYKYGGGNLQDFFLHWQHDLIDHMNKNANIIDHGDNLYFIKYELRHNVKVPKEKTERREFLESFRLLDLRFYKTAKQAIIRNILWYLLLHRDYEKARNKIDKLNFGIAVLGFICLGFIFYLLS